MADVSVTIPGEGATWVKVDLPYSLRAGQLVLEPEPTGGRGIPEPTIEGELARAADVEEWLDQVEVCARQLMSALLLYYTGAGPLAKCPETATIWECG